MNCTRCHSDCRSYYKENVCCWKPSDDTTLLQKNTTKRRIKISLCPWPRVQCNSIALSWCKEQNDDDTSQKTQTKTMLRTKRCSRNGRWNQQYTHTNRANCNKNMHTCDSLEISVAWLDDDLVQEENRFFFSSTKTTVRSRNPTTFKYNYSFRSIYLQTFACATLVVSSLATQICHRNQKEMSIVSDISIRAIIKTNKPTCIHKVKNTIPRRFGNSTSTSITNTIHTRSLAMPAENVQVHRNVHDICRSTAHATALHTNQTL